MTRIYVLPDLPKHQPRFKMGKLNMTVAALLQFDQFTPEKELARHLSGDFGTIPVNQVTLNHEAIANKTGTVISQFFEPKGKLFYIITRMERTARYEFEYESTNITLEKPNG